MAGSTLDPDNIAGGRPAAIPAGHDTRSLGPSDSSDSGSDMAGPHTGEDLGDRELDGASDRHGTGERSSAGREPDAREGADVEADRVVEDSEAGLGGGLDQAEEAQRGKTHYGRLDTEDLRPDPDKRRSG